MKIFMSIVLGDGETDGKLTIVSADGEARELTLDNGNGHWDVPANSVIQVHDPKETEKAAFAKGKKAGLAEAAKKAEPSAE